MLSQRHENPRLQSDFYRDNYRKILRGLLVSIVGMIFLLAIIIYLVLFKPLPSYYATTPDGQIISMNSTPSQH